MKCGPQSRARGVLALFFGVLLAWGLFVYIRSHGLLILPSLSDRVSHALSPASGSPEGLMISLLTAPWWIMIGALLLWGLFDLFGETTYYLTPALIRCETRFLIWTHAREYLPGRLILRLTHDGRSAPNDTIWKWLLQVEDVEGKRCGIIGGQSYTRYFPKNDCFSQALNFAHASDWKLVEQTEFDPRSR